MSEKIFSLLCFLMVAFGFSYSYAIAGVPAGMETNMKALGNAARYSTESTNDQSMYRFIGSLVSIFLGALGVVFSILFIVAGYHWMMAGGDTAKIDKAKDTMWRAIIGLLIIIGAYAIQQYVFVAIY